MSSRQLEDWADLAEEQGWRVLRKPGGKYAFYPPAGTVPPDLRALNMIEHGDGHRGNDNNRALLKRAGLKFPEDIAREQRERNRQMSQTNGQQSQCERGPAPADRRPPDPIDQAISICNRMAELAAEQAGLLEQIRKSVKDKTAQARAVLDAFDVLAKARGA